MSEKFCINCGKRFSFNEKFCINCGNERKRSRKLLKLLRFFLCSIGGLFLLFLLLIYLLEQEENNELSALFESFMKSSRKEVEVLEENSIISTVVNVFCPYAYDKLSFDSEGTGGSGVVVTEDGWILTNNHIIPKNGDLLDVNEEGCIVVFPDESTGLPREAYLAKPYVIEDLSYEYDLALLIINDVYVGEDGESFGTLPKKFYSISDDDCNEKELKLGEPIKAYGYPSGTGGYSLTVTEGVISAFTEDGIYISAKISQGNSGGLAADLDGCFIGIPTAVSLGEYESYGLIIPSYETEDFIKKFVSQIEETE